MKLTFILAVCMIGCAGPMGAHNQQVMPSGQVNIPPVDPNPEYNEEEGDEEEKEYDGDTLPPPDHPCWKAVKKGAGEYYDSARDWVHEITSPDCKTNPTAHGCR